MDLESCRDNRERLQAVKSWLDDERPSVLIIGYDMFRILTLLEEDKPPQPSRGRKNDGATAKKKLTKKQKELEKMKPKFREYLHDGLWFLNDKMRPAEK